MATFRIPSDWRELDRGTTAADWWPTANARHQAAWRLRHPEQERAQQRLGRWKRCYRWVGPDQAGPAPC